jgi:hypothetical protein
MPLIKRHSINVFKLIRYTQQMVKQIWIPIHMYMTVNRKKSIVSSLTFPFFYQRAFHR